MSEHIVIKKVRLSYEHIFKATSFEGNDPKYSATFIIPKKEKTQVRLIKDAIQKAFEDEFPGKKLNSKYHYPLKDGDELSDQNPEYADSYILRASSTRKPCAVDRRKEEVTAEDDILYSGCYVNASLGIAGFDVTAKKGVTAYLNGVQFVKDGERLAGYDAMNDFDEIEDEDEEDEVIDNDEAEDEDELFN